MSFKSGDIDVIHATTIAMPPRSKPLVVTIHDLIYLQYPEAHTGLRGRGLKALLPLSARASHRVVVPADSARLAGATAALAVVVAAATGSASWLNGLVSLVLLGLALVLRIALAVGRLSRSRGLW